MSNFTFLMEANASERNIWLYRGRLFSFSIIFAFMVFGPFYRQVLGGKNDLFRRWSMFERGGLGVVEAIFRLHFSSGNEFELDRFKILGYENPYKAPINVRRIKGQSGLNEVVQKICATLGSDVDVRVTSRIATRKGWRQLDRGTKNACRESMRMEDPKEDEEGDLD